MFCHILYIYNVSFCIMQKLHSVSLPELLAIVHKHLFLLKMSVYD